MSIYLLAITSLRIIIHLKFIIEFKIHKSFSDLCQWFPIGGPHVDVRDPQLCSTVAIFHFYFISVKLLNL